MIDLSEHKLPGEILADVAGRVARRRKELGLTQKGLAEKSGVSLGSIKRFEREHQISFASLVRIAFALNCQDDFSVLFVRRQYASIEDVVREAKRKR